MEYISKRDKDFHQKELTMAIEATSDKKMYIRYRCIYMYYDGMKKSEIAKVFGICYHTVNEYIRKYKSKGIMALEPKPIPGPSEKLNKEQKEQLKNIIVNHTPADVGFEARMNWTASLAAQWVKREFGVEYTSAGMTDLMHRLNLSYTKPTYSLAKADKQKQEKFCDTFEDLKKIIGRKNRPYFISG